MLKNVNQPENKTDSKIFFEAKSHIIVEIIEYLPNALLSKTIVKKSAGNVSVMSFESEAESTEKISPFNTYLQIIEGNAEIVLDKLLNTLHAGESILIPANTANVIKPTEGLKMILTTINSDDE